MDSNREPRIESPSVLLSGKKRTRFLAVILTFLIVPSAYGVDWRIRPTFRAMETYSDNINLAPTGGGAIPGAATPQSSLVTGLYPGLSLSRNGPWRVNLNYRMQNLIYAGDYSGVNIFNQFQFTTSGELIKDSVSLNVSSTAGQANIGTFGTGFNRGGIYPVDNLARTGNTTNFSNFFVNSSWRPHFSGYVEGLVSVNYYHTGTGAINNSTNSAGIRADGLSQFVNLYSGNQFDLIGWRVNMGHNQYLSSGGDNVASGNSAPRFLNYNGQIQYRLTEKIQPFVQAGGFQNSFGNDNSVLGANNGSYWNAGLIWTPNRRLFMQAGVGPSNYFLTFRSTPSKRTELALIYRESDVGGATGFGRGGGGGGRGIGGGGGSGGGVYKAGLPGACSAALSGGAGVGAGRAGYGVPGLGTALGFGVGSAGVNQLGNFNAGGTLNAGLCHRTRRTFYLVSYNEFTTTTPLLLSAQDVFDQSTAAAVNANEPYGIQFNGVNLVSPYEVITLRGGQASISHTYAKSTYSLSAYQQDRDYQYSGVQSVLGITATWSSRFARRTRGILSFSWQSQDNSFIAQPDFSSSFKLIQLGIYHSFWTNLSGGLTYRYTTQSSDSNPFADYEENRVTASISMSF